MTFALHALAYLASVAAAALLGFIGGYLVSCMVHSETCPVNETFDSAGGNSASITSSDAISTTEIGEGFPATGSFGRLVSALNTANPAGKAARLTIRPSRH
jgi:hypothetical protein